MFTIWKRAKKVGRDWDSGPGECGGVRKDSRALTEVPGWSQGKVPSSLDGGLAGAGSPIKGRGGEQGAGLSSHSARSPGQPQGGGGQTLSLGQSTWAGLGQWQLPPTPRQT